MRPNLDKPARRKTTRARVTVDERAGRIDQHVANRLRIRREEIGLTQAEFAKRMGLTVATLRRYESGSVAITAGRLLVLAEALDCDPDYFFAQFEDNPPAE